MAFIVQIENNRQFNSYLVQNNKIIELGSFSYNDPPFPPVLYNEELLWARATENDYVQVQASNGDVVFSFATYFGVRLPVNFFNSWKDNWIFEVDNFLIEDGEIINEKFGLEEAFGWRLINDKPFYFFRKGKNVGISYDGKFLPLSYDEIAHGFCCGLMANDPVGNGNTVRFFAKRDGTWYYIVVDAY